MSDTLPFISVSLVDLLQTNAPAGTVMGSCATPVANPTWSLGPMTSDGFRIDAKSGQLVTTVSPLPFSAMTAEIVMTVDSVSHSLTVPVTAIQMAEFQGVALNPNQLTTSPAGTLVGTVRAFLPTTIPNPTITYKLASSEYFTLDGDQLYLAAELPAGTYPATIGVSSEQANQPNEYTISVTVIALAPPPTLQEEATSILNQAVVEVDSPSNPGIEGRYAADIVHRNNITSIASAINAGLGLPSGTDTFFYPDIDNVAHDWGADNFMQFAKAVMSYIYLVSEVAGGRSDDLPGNVITI